MRVCNNNANNLLCQALAGVSTSGVILSTVRWLADSDYHIFVIENCCGDRDEEVGIPRPINRVTLGPFAHAFVHIL
eukprot:2778208-Pyramimonas_sp.AAC.3